jgi:predicted RNase H-like HicB family nuclease
LLLGTLLAALVGAPRTAPFGVLEAGSYTVCRGSMKYKIAIHKSDEGFSVCVPGLPGCWSQGATEAEALEKVRDAIRGYVSVVEEQLKGKEVREVEITV